MSKSSKNRRPITVSKKDYRYVFCDGGVYENLRLVKWAFVVVSMDYELYHKFGTVPYSGNHTANVENAEAQAIYEAFLYIKENPGNYVVMSDSQAMIDKIQKKVSNATRHPHVKAIQNMIEEIKYQPAPTSAVLKYHKRRSDKWSCYIDDVCNKNFKDEEETENLS
jgi:ribonuclease HI